MFKWLKKHFIPQEDNEFFPSFLRSKNTANVLLIVFFFEAVYLSAPLMVNVSNYNLAAVLPAVVSSLTNEERTDNNLPVLTVDSVLEEAARLKAEDMATNGYFAHISPEGKTPWYWLNQVDYEYNYAGENLAVNFSDSKDVTNAWMKSPTHRANVVKEAYTEVGTGVSEGVYKGKPAIFVVQMYANPVSRRDIVEEQDIVNLAVAGKNIQEEVKDATREDENGVLGASTQVQERDAAASVSSETSGDVGFIEKAVSSPRHAVVVVLSIVFGVVLVALMLGVLIKFGVQHKRFISNGLFVLVVIVALLIVNNNVGKKEVEISQSIDFSADQIVL